MHSVSQALLDFGQHGVVIVVKCLRRGASRTRTLSSLLLRHVAIVFISD